MQQHMNIKINMNIYKGLKKLLSKYKHFYKKLKKINIICIEVKINRFHFFPYFHLIQDPRRYHFRTLRYQLKIILVF